MNIVRRVLYGVTLALALVPSSRAAVLARSNTSRRRSRAAHRPSPLLSCFVDAVSERDRELLNELDRMVRNKRRELGRSK